MDASEAAGRLEDGRWGYACAEWDYCWGKQDTSLLPWLLSATECHNSFHIEVRIATGRGFKLRIVYTQAKNGRKHRRGLGALNEIKFNPQIVVNSVKEIFGSFEYKKVLVVWDVKNDEVIKGSEDVYNIEIWKLSDVMSEIIEEMEPDRIGMMF